MPYASEINPYQLSEAVLSQTDDFSAVEYTEPGEAQRDEMLLRKLGVRGWGRLHYFRQIFSGPWGSGEGRPLSPRAVEAFFTFLAAADLPEDSQPSLFLTDDGHLELCWEDCEGKAVQLEFGPRETEIYLESRGLEKSVPNCELAHTASNLLIL